MRRGEESMLYLQVHDGTFCIPPSTTAGSQARVNLFHFSPNAMAVRRQRETMADATSSVHLKFMCVCPSPSVNDTISHQAHCGTQRSVSEPRDPRSLQNAPEASEASTNCQELRVSDVSRDVLPPYLVRA